MNFDPDFWEDFQRRMSHPWEWKEIEGIGEWHWEQEVGFHWVTNWRMEAEEDEEVDKVCRNLCEVEAQTFKCR